ncbi:class I SAM-dependent methyltransferase [Aliikangiella maris]|uniref:SAM-dependent methyltransferase n=2 Tax=Aliikangiella maris TaxID=3162458 RepID=A0ABV3MLI3_9GAMM
MSSQTILPENTARHTVKVSAQAMSIHQQISQLIEQKIESSQSGIRFSEFMQLALYTPALGYYQNSLFKLGDKGDFITAPEMGNLFARCISTVLADNFNLTKTLSNVSPAIFELGAGSGKLAADLMTHLTDLHVPLADYYILETSPSLQSLQAHRLERLSQQDESTTAIATQVHWLERFPTEFSGVILANEVVDAMPFERICLVDGVWHYWLVTQVSQKNTSCSLHTEAARALFDWTLGEPVELRLLPDILRDTQQFPNGYTTEIRPTVKGWLAGLYAGMQQGSVYLFDYGYPATEYYHPQRINGTAKCFSRHQEHNNLLALAGLQDITAHVDFSQLAFDAVSVGFDVSGFTTQSGFLLESGILEWHSGGRRVEDIQMSQQIQKLIAPGQMGEIVKVIRLDKNINQYHHESNPLSHKGFVFQDQLGRL